MGGRKNWDVSMKQVALAEPTSLLDQLFLGCTQRERKPNLKIVQEGRYLLESRFSAGTVKHLRGWERSREDTVAWSRDTEGHAKKCLESYFELANTKIEQSHKVSTP